MRRRKMTKDKVLSLISILILQLACTSDSFQIIKSEEFDKKVTFEGETPLTQFNFEKYEIIKNESYLLEDSLGRKIEFSNDLFVTFIDDNYIGVTSGVRAIDDGIKFFFLPTYSNLIVIEKISHEIVFQRRVFDEVYRFKKIGSEIYFKYGKYPDYKYGYFDFNSSQ